MHSDGAHGHEEAPLPPLQPPLRAHHHSHNDGYDKSCGQDERRYGYRDSFADRVCRSSHRHGIEWAKSGLDPIPAHPFLVKVEQALKLTKHKLNKQILRDGRTRAEQARKRNWTTWNA